MLAQCLEEKKRLQGGRRSYICKKKSKEKLLFSRIAVVKEEKNIKNSLLIF